MNFPSEFFQSMEFTKEQIVLYFQSADKDLKTSKESSNPDVILHFSYSSILKLGIALIAQRGFKVRSIPGHHIKILEAMTKITDLNDEMNYIQRIRRKRNIDLYEGGISLNQKEIESLQSIVEQIFSTIQKKFIP